MQQFIHPQSRTKQESWMAQAITVHVHLSRRIAALIMCAAWPHALRQERGPGGCHGNAQSFLDLRLRIIGRHYVSLKTYILMQKGVEPCSLNGAAPEQSAAC